MNWFTNFTQDYIGFRFRNERIEEQEERKLVAVEKINNDGARIIDQGVAAGALSTGTQPADANIKDVGQLITKYREMASTPELQRAVDDIVNEAIVNEDNEASVKIVLDKVPELSKNIEEQIIKEFENILGLLNFNSESYELFRRWYVDGRIHFFKVIDREKPEKGLVELRYIDPRKIQKVMETKDIDTNDRDFILKQFNQIYEEYFLYNPNGISHTEMSGIKFPSDTITYVTSGITDPTNQYVLSHLHQAIRPLNMIRQIEDALMVYRITRAPERRAIYVDTGDLPKIKAEQVLNDVMQRMRSKINYDPASGEIKSNRRFMSILDDYFIAKNGSNSGTEIKMLESGQNLGEIKDAELFKKNLYESLNIPASRYNAEATFSLGRSAEIIRDEIKFSKFISRLRRRFAEVFDDALKTQLALKNIMKPHEFDKISKFIYYDWVKDNSYYELKELEIMTARLQVVDSVSQYEGKLYSQKWIRNKILQQTDDDIRELDKEIEIERAKRRIKRKKDDEEINSDSPLTGLGAGDLGGGAPLPTGDDAIDMSADIAANTDISSTGTEPTGGPTPPPIPSLPNQPTR